MRLSTRLGLAALVALALVAVVASAACLRLSSPTRAVSVRVDLTDRAKARLARDRDSICLSMILYGQARPSARGLADDMNQVSLGREKVACTGAPSTVDLGRLSYPRYRELLISAGPTLDIQASSLNRSNHHNSYDCSTIIRPLAGAATTDLPMTCDLLPDAS